jgi:hypothetical protein
MPHYPDGEAERVNHHATINPADGVQDCQQVTNIWHRSGISREQAVDEDRVEDPRLIRAPSARAHLTSVVQGRS